MLNARAIAVQGYGYGSRAIAGRGFVETAGGALHMAHVRARRARPMRPYEEPDESAIQRLDLQRRKQAIVLVPGETSTDIDKQIERLEKQAGNVAIYQAFNKPSTDTELVELQAALARGIDEQIVFLKRKRQLLDNRNRILILLALLEL